jgi:pimeloyl-ACP methyl ester carboxylesterase
MTPSAVGERQMFPMHTNKIRMAGRMPGQPHGRLRKDIWVPADDVGVGIRRGMVAAAMLGVAALLLPAGAAARVRWHDCIPVEGCEGRLTVPLDRTGAIPGTAVLELRRWKTFGGVAKRPPVILLAGGPDVMGTAVGEGYAGALDGSLLQGQRRVLYTFDPRGLSNVGRVDCSSLGAPGDLDDPSKVAACANELGPRRNLSGARDMADDLESVRAAIEAPRILIVAEGAAAPVAVEYAREHADRVESLLLLSPDPPDGPDPLSLPSLSAIPRALGSACRRGCSSFTLDPAGDLADLARRAEASPLRGYTVDRRGKRHPATLGPRELLGLALASSDDEQLRSDLPGSVTAALRGDLIPILRLVRRARLALDDVGYGAYAIHAASACGDWRFPWDDAASPDHRRAQAAATAAALPDSDFGPLGRAAALATRQLTTCLAWPSPRPGPLPATSPVDVPALAIFGEEDIRRPLETASALRQALPKLVVSAVGGSGEPLFSNAPERCTDEIIAAFANGASVPPRCEHYDTPFSRPPHVDRPPPGRLAEVRPYGRFRGKIGRTLTALGLTLRDVFHEEDYARGDAPDYERIAGAGLRAGTFKSLSNGERLERVEFVPEVAVSGRLGVIRDGAFFRITGRAAAHGTIRFSARGRVTGVLDGHRIRTDMFHLLFQAERESRG